MQNSKTKIPKETKVKMRTEFSSPLKIKELLFILIISFIFLPRVAFGATLYLEPTARKHYLEDVFVTEIKIETGGEEINTAKVELTFPQELLNVLDFSSGDSILTLWPEMPTFSNQTGKIYFVGGIPGGYLGEGVLGKIIFQAKKEGRALIQIENSSQVLLNDGLGTPAKLETGGAIFEILAEKQAVPTNEWQRLLEEDKIPPEPFEVELGKEAAVFEGKYFIAFSTIDKQTGMDYYEVKEGKRDWEKAGSPCLLKDQSLKSKIWVKAIDKAGNERIAEYTPPRKITWKDVLPWMAIVLVLGGIIWWIIRKLKSKNEKQ